MSVRILLADDHPIFLDGLSCLLEKQTDLDVVATVTGGEEAVAVAGKVNPDLIIMDISMPGLNGIEATRKIRKNLPGVKVLCLSMHSQEQLVVGVLDGGAAGYVLKDCAFEELVRAIRTVIGGEVYLSPSVAGTLVRSHTAIRQGTTSTAFTRLSVREREVLQLIAEGHATKRIADRLKLSIKTIGSHREHVMQKLDIHSVAGLTKYAVRNGLTSCESCS